MHSAISCSLYFSQHSISGSHPRTKTHLLQKLISVLGCRAQCRGKNKALVYSTYLGVGQVQTRFFVQITVRNRIARAARNIRNLDRDQMSGRQELTHSRCLEHCHTRNRSQVPDAWNTAICAIDVWNIDKHFPDDQNMQRYIICTYTLDLKCCCVSLDAY